ncbi:MAG: M48 family metalloprotease [Dyadobacter sp.]|uniref:M48 family metallopeptidase n=1 Tax=Dyadobacter sp. TaxID=1914288 RepID=UPI001B2CB42D|nr:M48 family metallopeptidase [Dyadobacter sp.]MBO9612914.1 M48 family metalloprotease [Dyadobacter sp.]
MPVEHIKTSVNFRKYTLRASFAIAQFVILYFLLICGAVLLTGLCALGGYTLVYIKFNGLTFGLAIGLLCVGFFVLFFLIKFIFKKHIVDKSALTEITEKDQPELFALLREVVQEVQTDFPKKVYLSPEVNASVFYDSGFWSMFLPTRKNLQIGLGLVNSVTVSEFKAVLAHEFGHFSQRSMKVGSYVYHVNYIIYNMLYDNGSFDGMLEKWGSSNFYITISSSLAKWVVKGIQWILRKAYNIININYFALSREMEFHADEVAAHVAGSAPLASALKRFELADYAYNMVSGCYHRQAPGPRNFYVQHAFALTFLAEKDHLTFQHGLPQIESSLSRYNKSKLVITDQWASHPSVEDRVEKLMALNQATRNEDSRRAYELFRKIGDIQQAFTHEMFFGSGLASDMVFQTDQEFQEAFLSSYEQNSYSEIFNGYYDIKNPVFPETENNAGVVINPAQLFNDEMVDNAYLEITIESDIQTIEAINEGRYPVKSFDYDGIKYTAEDAAFLLPNLRKELAAVHAIVAKNDTRIDQFFTQTARQQQKYTELKPLISNIGKVRKTNEELHLIYQEMEERTHFFTLVNPAEQIEINVAELSETETRFKKQLTELQKNPLYSPNMTSEMKQDFDKYLESNGAYFLDETYDEEAIQTMFGAFSHCNLLVYQTAFAHKKHLLDFLAELYHAHQPANIAS